MFVAAQRTKAIHRTNLMDVKVFEMKERPLPSVVVFVRKKLPWGNYTYHGEGNIAL